MQQGTDLSTPKGWMLSKANKLHDYHKDNMGVHPCSGTSIWLYDGSYTDCAFVLKHYHLRRGCVGTYKLLLMKVKSHAGCLLIERAHALADLGALSEEEQTFPGPSKYGTLWLRARESWRDRVRSEQLHHVLPRDSVQTRVSLSRSLQSIFSA